MPDADMNADIRRMEQMERRFDGLCAAVKSGKIDHNAQQAARMLEVYYTGGQWLSDYERDERGGWPANLKRGVLSEDGLYDLLAQADALMNGE